MNSLDHDSQNEPQEEPESLRQVFPLFKSWGQLYAFVLAELVLLIVLFYLFSKAFA